MLPLVTSYWNSFIQAKKKKKKKLSNYIITPQQQYQESLFLKVTTAHFYLNNRKLYKGVKCCSVMTNVN